MINHVVLFQFKNSIKDHEIHHLFEEIRKLSQFFPGIKNFSWGRNNNQEGLCQGFEYGLFLQFDSEATRQAYASHPFNHEISESIVKPALRDGLRSALVFDYYV